MYIYLKHQQHGNGMEFSPGQLVREQFFHDAALKEMLDQGVICVKEAVKPVEALPQPQEIKMKAPQEKTPPKPIAKKPGRKPARAKTSK